MLLFLTFLAVKSYAFHTLPRVNHTLAIRNGTWKYFFILLDFIFHCFPFFLHVIWEVFKSTVWAFIPHWTFTICAFWHFLLFNRGFEKIFTAFETKPLMGALSKVKVNPYFCTHAVLAVDFFLGFIYHLEGYDKIYKREIKISV